MLSVPFIEQTKEVTSSRTKKKTPVQGLFNCSTSGVVYVITCNKCDKQYVGQTSRNLKDRIQNHLQYIRQNKEATGIHFNLPGHRTSDLKVQVIEKVFPNEKFNLLEREDFWIKKMCSKVPFGLNKNN